MAGLLVGQAACAQWLPHAACAWEREPTDGNVDAVGVHAMADGGLVAGVRFNRSNQQHLAVFRFDMACALQWVRGPADGAVRGFRVIQPLHGKRFAVVGTPLSGANVFVRVLDAGSGDLLWMRESSLGVLGEGSQVVAESPAGELLIAVADAARGDYAVLRLAADGGAMPSWRWHAGADVRVSAIAALADGGAVVTGVGEALGGGYATVRFDATGALRFHDLEPGDRGSPLGPAHLAVDATGGIVVAGTPEDGQLGVPEVTVWKLAGDGRRAWKRVLGVDAAHPLGRDLKRFRLAANGDVLVVLDGGPHDNPHRLVRLAAADGRTLWEAPFSFSIGLGESAPRVLAEAPNGRLLLAGDVITGQVPFARLLEFTGDGRPCRRRDDRSMYVVGAATASAAGWQVLGTASGPTGVNGALAQRDDADGPCEVLADAIFGDGFDAAAARIPAPRRGRIGGG